MKIGVVGVGCVGLTTAVCLASKFRTIATDKDSSRIRELEHGIVPIHEKGLKSLLTKAVRAERLTFSSDLSALAGTDIIFIAVGTPSKEDGSIDLSQVRTACMELGRVISTAKKKRQLVMVRSTVIPGTARRVVGPLLEGASGKKCGTGFGLCSDPEFLREGYAVQDMLVPHRIVLGPADSVSLRSALSLYRAFYGKKMPPIVETTPEGAELIKYGSNALLASRVSLINLLANVCELFPDIDVDDVALGMGLDPRIGRQFLQAGPGFGGSCFGKDLHAFSAFLKQLSIDPSMLEGVLKVNDLQPGHVVAMAESRAGPLAGKKVAVLGLAFKEDTGDTRGSRSLPVIRGLLERGAHVHVFDPIAVIPPDSGLSSRVVVSTSAEECIEAADLVIAMTAWQQFKKIRPHVFAELMRTPVLIDARRMYDPQEYSEGLRYSAIGRGREVGPKGAS